MDSTFVVRSFSIVIPERSEGLLFHQTLDFHRVFATTEKKESKKAKRLATPVIAIEIWLWGFV